MGICVDYVITIPIPQMRESNMDKVSSWNASWNALVEAQEQPMSEVKTEIRQNQRFTASEVEALLEQLSQDERRFGEE